MDTFDALPALLRAGGWAMAPLYACSIVGVAWTLHLLIRVQAEHIGRTTLLTVPLRPLSALRDRAAAEDTALGRVVVATVDALASHPGRAEEAATRAALVELDRWEGPVEVLALLARIAPLFGLLGTVLGMVDLFGSMEAAGESVSAGALSGGIWKALLTTAAGLIIAIPAMAMHAWMIRRIERLRLILEEGAGRILDAALDRPAAP